MKLLVARKDDAGCWQKAVILNAYADGHSLRNVPARHCGQIESAFARQAARYFAAEQAARTVFYQCGGREYRVDLV
jgi:hypothetical protein